MIKQQDKMALAEATKVIESFFYQKVLKKTADRRDFVSGLTDTSMENIRFNQGQIRALDDVLGYHNTVKRELIEKSG